MKEQKAGEMGERSQEQDTDRIRDVELIDDGRLCTRVSNVAFGAKEDTASQRPC